MGERSSFFLYYRGSNPSPGAEMTTWLPRYDVAIAAIFTRGLTSSNSKSSLTRIYALFFRIKGNTISFFCKCLKAFSFP